MFHALFDLESEPDPHPNKKLLRPCVRAGGNGFVECWQNNFRTNFINTIQYNTFIHIHLYKEELLHN